MSEQTEFAEEHSRTEKVCLVVLYLTVGTAVVLASKLWLLPGIREFAASAHCQQVLGISGLTVLFYGLFVGMPLGVALVVGLTLGRRGYRILSDGRLPPVGEKVFRPTRIERGTKAKLIGIVQLLAPLMFVAIAVWGVPQAKQLLSSSERGEHTCGGIADRPTRSAGYSP